MLNIYKTNIEGKTTKVKDISQNSWIELINPTQAEIKQVVDITKTDEDLIMKLLDDEELPRIETTENATLIVVDTPYLADSTYKHKYDTYPIGLIINNQNYFITVSLKDLGLLNDFKKNKVKEFYTDKKTRFVIQILLKIASLYQKELKDINNDIHKKEKTLSKSTNNKELIYLLNIEKTLVYFTTSLKANDVVLDKLYRGNVIKLYDEDLELLDDAIIENKQGIEMANIYREILTSMTDTYATIISNNLNDIMKFLASITIVFSIPTMIASFLGMNVSLGSFANNDYSFILIIVISFIIAGIIAWILKKKDML